jgi:hypothetical protein
MYEWLRKERRNIWGKDFLNESETSAWQNTESNQMIQRIVGDQGCCSMRVEGCSMRVEGSCLFYPKTFGPQTERLGLSMEKQGALSGYDFPAINL